LAQFEALLAAAKGKQIVLFLDYDGTLSPIVEDPDRAVMSEEVGQQSSPTFFFCLSDAKDSFFKSFSSSR
jgi:hypothetical protein